MIDGDHDKEVGGGEVEKKRDRGINIRIRTSQEYLCIDVGVCVFL